MPTVVPLVAAGVGVGVGVGVASSGLIFSVLRPPARLWALLRLPMLLSNCVIALVGGVAAGVGVAFLPLGAGLPALERRGVSSQAALVAMLLMHLVPPLLLPASRPLEVRADLLLFFLVLWHHAYLLAWPALLNSGIKSGEVSPDLYLTVGVAGVLSLAMHARLTLFDSTTRARRDKGDAHGSYHHSHSHSRSSSGSRRAGSTDREARNGRTARDGGSSRDGRHERTGRDRGRHERVGQPGLGQPPPEPPPAPPANVTAATAGNKKDD